MPLPADLLRPLRDLDRVALRSMVRSVAIAVMACAGLVGQSGSGSDPAAVEGLPPAVHADRLMVRVAAADLGRRMTEGDFGEGADSRALAARIAGVRPLFAGTDGAVAAWFARFDDWHAELVARDGAEAPENLGRYLRVTVGDRADAASVAARLAAVPGVEEVAFEPVAVLAGRDLGGNDIPPTTPDWSRDQAWFAPAPAAFGLGRAHAILGGRGQDVTIWHVEEDWLLGHEDLTSLTPASWLGGPPTPRSGTNHGTAVVGLLVADRNGFGVTGTADRATLRLASTLRLGGYTGALGSVIAAGAPGDVIALILAFDIRQVQPRDLVPVEYFDPWFQAIRTATGRGFVVVEAAGNGGNDLDDPRFQGRFDPAVRDSGAILVGGTDGARFVRERESNFGRRVTCAGWAGDVITTGYGSLFYPGGDDRQAYTERYSGTSTASSLVTGVVAAFVGAVRRQEDRTVTVAEVRDLLERLGTPVPGNIGRRPDLTRMLGAVGLPDGLTAGSAEVDRGQAVAYRLTGAPRSQAFLLVGAVPGDVPLGANRRLHLDVGSALVLPAVTLDAAGTADVGLPVPPDPALVGLELYAQGVQAVGGGLRLTSSAVVQVR